MKKTIFVSDFHIGAGKEWDWFTDKEGRKVIDFCNYIIERDSIQKDIKEIVLLGDIFDLWVCPHNKIPHTFQDICKKQKLVLNAVKKMAITVPTIYVNGNHDYQVTSRNIEFAFGGRVKHFGSKYIRKNILAVHGHQYTLFNKPDPKNGGALLQLPLGYYLTRLHTTLGESRKAKANLVLQVLDESLQLLGTEKLPESILDVLKDAVANHTGITPQIFRMGHLCKDQSYAEVKDRYRNLFDDWIDSIGFWKSVQMILCEMDRLGPTADRLCKNGTEIVIMGHSHGTKMDKDRLIGRDRIYANCGYWCGMGEIGSGKNNAHFVQTDGNVVELCAFRNNNSIIRKTLTLG